MSTHVLPVVYDTTTLPGRLLAIVDRILMVALVAAVVVMVAVVSAQVVLRYGFNMSIDWAEEISRLTFVWSIFLAIPLGVRQGAHIGIDIVVAKMPGPLQTALRRGAAAVSAGMMLIIAWASIGVAREQWDEYMGTLDWSVGWFIVPVGVGAAISALHLLRIVVDGPPELPAGAAE